MPAMVAVRKKGMPGQKMNHSLSSQKGNCPSRRAKHGHDATRSTRFGVGQTRAKHGLQKHINRPASPTLSSLRPPHSSSALRLTRHSLASAPLPSLALEFHSHPHPLLSSILSSARAPTLALRHGPTGPGHTRPRPRLCDTQRLHALQSRRMGQQQLPRGHRGVRIASLVWYGDRLPPTHRHGGGDRV